MVKALLGQEIFRDRTGGRPDFCMITKAYYSGSIQVDRADKIHDTLKEAFNYGETCIVDTHTNPKEDALPMLPPNLNLDAIKGRCRF